MRTLILYFISVFIMKSDDHLRHVINILNHNNEDKRSKVFFFKYKI